MSLPHKTVPIQVWIDADAEVAETVLYLNTIPGVRTLASCQGTIGEGGPSPYRAQIMAAWELEANERIHTEFDVDLTDSNGSWGYLRPKGGATKFVSRKGDSMPTETNIWIGETGEAGTPFRITGPWESFRFLAHGAILTERSSGITIGYFPSDNAVIAPLPVTGTENRKEQIDYPPKQCGECGGCGLDGEDDCETCHGTGHAPNCRCGHADCFKPAVS